MSPALMTGQYMVGGCRGFRPGECTGLLATDLFKDFCPGPFQTGGAVLRLMGFLEGLRCIGG